MEQLLHLPSTLPHLFALLFVSLLCFGVFWLARPHFHMLGGRSQSIVGRASRSPLLLYAVVAL
jgi:hypothetical protein